jgi:hypothetical protein
MVMTAMEYRADVYQLETGPSSNELERRREMGGGQLKIFKTLPGVSIESKIVQFTPFATGGRDQRCAPRSICSPG